MNDAPRPATDLSRLERLKVLRHLQEKALAADSLPARELAAVSKEYRATLAEIAVLTEADEKKGGVPGDPIDEVSARRAARGGATARPGRAAK